MKKETETTKDGKVIETTSHKDGRKSVKVNVGALNLENPTQSDLDAKEMIEKKVLHQLGEQKVHVIVLHKPSNTNAALMVKQTDVRNFAEAAVDSLKALVKDLPEQEMKQYEERMSNEDFAVIEISDGGVRVTTL